MPEPTNINTIARLAGVSTTTVSNFINCTETIPISPEKQLRLREIMRARCYRPSPASSNLRRKSALPGKVVFIYGSFPASNVFNTARNPHLGDLIQQLDTATRRHLGLALELRSVEDDTSIASWNEAIADAEAVISYGRLSRHLLMLSERRNVPLAVVSDTEAIATDGPAVPDDTIDAVYWDAARHLETILDHLRQRGARRLTFVSSWNIKANHPAGYAVEAEAKIERFRSWLAAHPELSGEVVSPPWPQDLDQWYESRNAYLAIRGREELFAGTDAWVGHNDLVAQGIICALQERGQRPGVDVKVAGEGDYAESRHLLPGLTTIAFDRAALAQAVCSILKRRAKDNRAAGERIRVPSRLIIRETA